MIKNTFQAYSTIILCVLTVAILGSCSSTRTSYKSKYAAAWKKVLNSQEWKDALKNKINPDSYVSEEYYVTTSDVVILEAPEPEYKESSVFVKKYNSLVLRAYFKIIREAEKADKHIEAEYERLNSEKNSEKNKKDKTFKSRLALANRKYEAHKNMITGLKAWKVFTQDITGDLEYFKAENESEIYRMYTNGESDKDMINVLVYKLADLYHYKV